MSVPLSIVPITSRYQKSLDTFVHAAFHRFPSTEGVALASFWRPITTIMGWMVYERVFYSLMGPKGASIYGFTAWCNVSSFRRPENNKQNT